MKRNKDLVEEILTEIRDSDPFSLEPEDFHAGRLPGHWEIKKVSYHLVLLLEANFLARNSLHSGDVHGNGPVEDNGLRLTWRGHDLLDDLKSRKSY